MANIADNFRTKLSEKLKTALANRNKEEVSTIRSIMSSLDNASAMSKEDIAKMADTSVTEVPRKILSKEDIEDVLRSEISIRTNALNDYERLGNISQAELIRQSISTIQMLSSLLS